MKKILRYSFTLLLLLSCLVVVPFTFFRDRLATKEESAATTALQFVPSTRPRPTTTTTITAATTTTMVTVPGGEPVDGTFDTVDPTNAVETTTTTLPTTTLSQTQEALFADTLFIGDSRTYGFLSYKIKVPGAVFFSNEGMSSADALKRSLEIPGVGKVTLEELLQKKAFKQVYLMFGLNEINNNLNNDTIAVRYQQIIGKIAELQPNAKVIVQSTLHVTKAKNTANVKSGSKITNARINELNALLMQLVDKPYVYYLDINAAFDTEDGTLSTDYAAGDGMHIKARGYTAWRDFLFENRIL